MRITMLGPQSSHTAKWVDALRARGHSVHLVTVDRDGPVTGDVNVLRFRAPWGYYLNASHVRALVRRLRPELLHVHYATGYGLLGRFAAFRPCVLSVWGSDVYEFPDRSRWHRALLRRNLLHFDRICATSWAMGARVATLLPEREYPEITPFGVDTHAFRPGGEKGQDGTLTVGTVKSLDATYGIDLLIRGFAAARERLRTVDPAISARLRLLIVGSGPARSEYAQLVRELGVHVVTEMPGHVPRQSVPEWMNRMDVFVNMSRAESFGVAVLEASACAVPVIASRVGGLPEVVEDGVTGFLLQPEDVNALTEQLCRLLLNSKLRRQIGVAGRRFVTDRYEWKDSVARMMGVYASVLSARAAVVSPPHTGETNA